MRLWPRREARPAATPSGVADLGVPASGRDRAAQRFDVGSAPVVLLTRQGCHLCEEATPLVQGECDARSIDVEVLDVDADPALREQFTNHVPVLLVRGVLVDYWRVDAERLRRALDGQPVDPPAPL